MASGNTTFTTRARKPISTTSSRWPLAAPLEDFFNEQILGPQLGTYYGYPIYHSPNLNNLYQPVTPQEYAAWAGIAQTNSEAWTQNLNVQVNNTDLFSVPAGSAGIAGLLQVGNQAWNNPIDPHVSAGDFYGLTGTSGSARATTTPAPSSFACRCSAR